MNGRVVIGARRFWRGEQGQVLPVAALMLVMLLGMAALAIDVGRLYYLQRKLQASTDAEALAAASEITPANAPSDVYAVALKYSSAGTGWNASPQLPTVTASQPQLKCLQMLTKQNQFCVGPVPYNAVEVTQTMVVPMYFAGVVGWKTMTITTAATAAAHGGAPRYANIAIIMDTTLSMGEVDTNCSSVTQMSCALSGVSVLLNHLVPCPVTQGTCVASATRGQVQNSIQRTAMFAFPAVTVDTVNLDTGCTTPIPAATSQNGYWGPAQSGTNLGYFTMPKNPALTASVAPWPHVPTAAEYGLPAYNATAYNPGTATGTPTYQVTPFVSDYRSSAVATTLNSASQIAMASSGLSGCGSMLPPNEAGVFGTYYAGAIYAAQASLTAQQALNPGSDNVIILLSDGDANAPQNNWGGPVIPTNNANGSYPSYLGQCSQAVDAANNATAAHTKFYTVAYGSPVTGCSTDATAGSHRAITPCQTMAAMATNSHFFYSDFNQSGTYSNCTTSFPTLSLSDIFLTIAVDLTTSRLVPNTWT